MLFWGLIDRTSVICLGNYVLHVRYILLVNIKPTTNC